MISVLTACFDSVASSDQVFIAQRFNAELSVIENIARFFFPDEGSIGQDVDQVALPLGIEDGLVGRHRASVWL